MTHKIEPNNVLSELSKFMLADGFDIVFDNDKSHGSYFYDSKNKREILDFFTFFASSPIGFNHKKLNNKEFIEKIGKIALHKPSNSDIYTVEMAEFVSTFARVAKPEWMKYLFFVSGGALAVENALKTAFDWKIRKNLSKGKGEKGNKILHFKHAFHGRSGYTLSLTNTFDPRKTKYFPKFDWPRVESPALHFPVDEQEIERIKKEEIKIMNEISNIIKNDGDDIAALLIEPIQAEGGDRHFRQEFFEQLRKITLDNDILFIVDEVQTGMGMTGKFWCIEHYNVKPDIISFGKKSQICGIIASDRVDEVKDNVFVEASRINSTWGGNLVDMVRSDYILRIIEEDKLVENAGKMGTVLLDGMKGIKTDKMSNIRGKGLLIAFDLANSKERDRMFDKLFENGLFTIKCGEKSIRFRPPLNLNKEDALKGIEILEKSLKQI
ncbi:TPA: L-lysine 6-transaminase [candidate division WOR-3 bacterium]|jgi:L-lysine 6-transaminase|uniref:L-lysine-epsilon aminotransferase n=1 Tax=candidate division WOR-3 bacterium TaxID=2052148 RepID=A0A350HAI1_UNCW3|nr:L-lysine 6-transaminase [candidate division WOR-3 bacterium]